MQGKGLVRFFLILMTIVTLFQFLLTIPTTTVEKNAEAYALKAKAKAKGNKDAAYKAARAAYLDSMSTEVVFDLKGLKKYTYQDLKGQQLAMGLDLKGGMSVVLQVDLEGFIRSLASNPGNQEFERALKKASQDQRQTQDNYVTLFARAYAEISGNKPLANLFSRTDALKDDIKSGDPNQKVINVLQQKADQTADLTFRLLKERIDKLGVTGPNVSLDNARALILVELPGIDNPQRARAFLQGAARLEFWNIYRLSDPINPNATTSKQIIEGFIGANEALAKTLGTGKTRPDTIGLVKVDSLGNALAKSKWKYDSIRQVPADNPLLELLQINTQGQAPALMGYAEKNKKAVIDSFLARPEAMAQFPRDLTFAWSKDPITDPTTKKPTNVYELYAIKKEGNRLEAPLSGDNVVQAYADSDQNTGKMMVSLRMDGEGAKTWAAMTTKAAQASNREIAITLDGEVISCPGVNEPITGGSSQISGSFTLEEAKDLANLLEVGKLPAETRIIQESIIGPTLGQDNINKGFGTLVITFLAILVFMVAYYAGGGVVAILALIINIFLLLGAMASLGTVLTLPGIAGIVLTIGMAVDANVIIYERIREELRAGLGLKESIQEGFKHAANAIIDGNLTTFISGVALAVFGLGPIKGFAIVLMLGIATTLFTGILVTRMMVEYWVGKGNKMTFSFPWSSHFLLDRNYNWMGFRHISYTFSGIVTIICILAVAIRGFDLGVDFKGGYSYNIQFDSKVNVESEQVREALTTEFGATPVVKAVDTENTFNVVTSYLVDSQDEKAGDHVIEKLFNGVNKIAGGNLELDAFKDYASTGTHVTSASKVGPTIADDIQRSSWKASLFGLLGIFLYVLLRFNKIKYGAGAVIATIHDVVFAVGMFALFHGILPFNMEIDQAFIASILTLIGYSLNDTVIVFDRIREYIHKFPTMKKHELINAAINSTLTRTIVTSSTVFLSVLILFFFGGNSIKGFAFAMLLGVIFGTYSSIFIAAPIVADLTKGDYLDAKFASSSTTEEGKGKGSSKAVAKV
ncbi:MAG: protein translocase subunit SecDF [Haliscomenobacter sp.]|uniref:protein translocase subunit SecDF n=1 Tax=Haliscomenobacter sp. TaxID=2717303 RepID=UPI0029B41FC3|nr:protein translocase subunit SecDF [Haliscomenobacter sp.]MDX2069371.1 protein translocase subunit SecDF [Haliscomenobacter sp.]